MVNAFIPGICSQFGDKVLNRFFMLGSARYGSVGSDVILDARIIQNLS
jgi:hypothetical protein